MQVGAPNFAQNNLSGINDGLSREATSGTLSRAHSQWTAEMERLLNGVGLRLERGMENLSDDELMLLVGQYTRQIDIEIRQHMTGMRARASQSRNYSAVLAEVRRQVSEAGTDRDSRLLNLDADVKIIDQSGMERTVKLRELVQSLGIKLPSPAKLDAQTVEAINTEVNKYVEDIRSQNEQGQLELQQIMSRRSQMLQITSNILASRNDSRKTIAQNMRG
jgi:hypothetical protein